MHDYNKLGYKIKRDLSASSKKIFKKLIRLKNKFVKQIIYGILKRIKSQLGFEITKAECKTVN